MKYRGRLIETNNEDICPECGVEDHTEQINLSWGSEERYCMKCKTSYVVYFEMKVREVKKGK